ncbi:MAG: hypothetical protein GY796_12045 [Chloroflexi bacterium]|nr:hypothetical protein [Chloroflexota bacterium]
MNNATFVSFSSDANLDLLPAGSKFKAAWTVRNSGTAAWESGCSVVHIHADTGSQLLTGQASYPFADVASKPTVNPGENVEITLEMTAPTTPNQRFFTDWQLKDAQGNLFGDIIWLRLVTTAPLPKEEDKPVVDSGPAGANNSKYIDDHSIQDGTPIEEGKTFLKQWVVRNNGDLPWTSAYRLVWVGGESRMAGQMSHTIPEAQPDAEVVLSVPMVSPPARGEAYTSSWRIHDDRNQAFGDSFWVKIQSTANMDGFGIRPYCQNDPQWKNHQLGTGQQTLGQFGCLLSCMTMMLTGFGENYTPLTLNNTLLNRPPGQGFDASNVYFLAPAYLIDHVKYYDNWMPKQQTGATFAQYDPNFLNRIDQEIASGQAVILQVDTDTTDPYTFGSEQHWVFVLAKQGNDYLILDPTDGRPVSLLARYGYPGSNQPSQDALKEAIKSALIYRSTKVRIKRGAKAPAAEPVEESKGVSAIGKTDGELKYTGPAWEFGHMLKGVHDRANRHPLQPDWDIARGRFESVKVMSGVSVEEMQKYQAQFYMCRLFESWNGRDVPVQDFVNTVANDIERLVNAGVKYFEFHNEPNLTHEGLRYKGVQGSWSNGAEFGQYFMQGRKLLRQRFPGIKVGFPGLSPGADAEYSFGHDHGFRMNDTTFTQQAQAAINTADFLCLHAYYTTMELVESDGIALVKKYRQMFPNKLIFITEFSNPDPAKDIPAEKKGKQAKRFYELCSQIPGVAAAYYFIVSGSGWDHQSLRRDADGRSTGVIEHML